MVVHPALALLRLRGGLLSSDPVSQAAAAKITDVAIQAPIMQVGLYVGTMMSALSGCISAGTKGMDLIGCITVGLVTAAGGGTIRDVMLNRPPFWILHHIHLHISIWTSALTFLIWPAIVASGFKDTHLAFLWSDAFGMAAATVIGTHIGLQDTDNWLIAVLCGVCSATFGGIGRDLLCQEAPRALYAERSMYATPALLGAVSYTLLQLAQRSLPVGIPGWMLLIVPFSVTLSLRAAAWTYRLALPHWARKKPRAFNFFDSNKIEIRIRNEKLGESEVPTPKEFIQKVSKKLRDA
mmetsp:Transcript_54697/g.96560  ORF Transcript_54697/g.96560 Transcript_54697/m.96560 type:complete len:295 (-) Transcript_54697:104-988(-)